MSDSLVIALFLFLVFAPCLVALSGPVDEDDVPGTSRLDRWLQPRRRDETALTIRRMMPEASLSDDFEIRTFAKGIGQRRLVVRDGDSGAKLTIGQVRAAAVELIRLGGMAAAHEYALLTAATALGMTAVKDAFALAAEQVLARARHASSWMAWGETAVVEASLRGPLAEGPPPISLTLDALPGRRRWRETAQAA